MFVGGDITSNRVERKNGFLWFDGGGHSHGTNRDDAILDPAL